MFFKLICWTWIVFGVYWFLRPNSIRRHFKKRVNKTFRRILMLIIVAAVGIFLWASRLTTGLMAKLLLIFALVGLIKVLFVAKSKITEKMIAWWAEQPLWLWRAWAAAFIIIGFILVRLK